MAGMKRSKTVLFLVGTMILVFLVGCYPARTGQSRYSTKTAAKKKTTKTGNFEFPDVKFPSQMKVEKKSTFVYQSGGFTAGVLSLKGRVEMNSLISFFEGQMARDGWQLVSSFISPHTALIFNKEQRWCVISISETDFRTQAKIWVAPTVQEPNSRPPVGAEDTGLFK